MSDDPRVMAVHLERGRHVRVDRDGSPRCACGWSWPDGRADDFERHVAETAVAALDAHDREHLRHVAFDSADNVAARERERIAQAIEADLNRWLSLGSPGAADSSVEGSVAWFVQRAYESCARIARGRA